MEEMEAENKGNADQAVRHEAGVPRRFGIGTMLIITTMYAVLFAVMQTLRLPLEGFVLVSLFFTAIGFGQMLLFKGRRPRRASIIVGACAYPCLAVGSVGFVQRNLDYQSFFFFLFPGLVCFIPTGAIMGYLAGMLIAAVFLLIDKLPFGKRRLP
jgi:hypothetical protein